LFFEFCLTEDKIRIEKFSKSCGFFCTKKELSIEQFKQDGLQQYKVRGSLYDRMSRSGNKEEAAAKRIVNVRFDTSTIICQKMNKGIAHIQGGRSVHMSMQSLCTDDGIQEMIERYSDMIYRIALTHMRTREDAEDIYQEVFLIYLQKQQTFREEEHRKAWLIRTTLTCCRRALSSSWKKRNILTDDAGKNYDISDGEPFVSFESKEENEVYIAVRALPEKYRTVIYLFYFEQQSVQEISEILKRRPGTVRMQLTRGRELMKQMLVQEEKGGGSLG
jgi:RNA polymerase sigma-70 factor (ECF subfamily)